MKTEIIDVLWWNVQRLFRPHGPGEARGLGLTVEPGWDAKAYAAKLENVAAVIRHAVSPETTGVIGLAEIEDVFSRRRATVLRGFHQGQLLIRWRAAQRVPESRRT